MLCLSLFLFFLIVLPYRSQVLAQEHSLPIQSFLYLLLLLHFNLSLRCGHLLLQILQEGIFLFPLFLFDRGAVTDGFSSIETSLSFSGLVSLAFFEDNVVFPHHLVLVKECLSLSTHHELLQSILQSDQFNDSIDTPRESRPDQVGTDASLDLDDVG